MSAGAGRIERQGSASWVLGLNFGDEDSQGRTGTRQYDNARQNEVFTEPEYQDDPQPDQVNTNWEQDRIDEREAQKRYTKEVYG